MIRRFVCAIRGHRWRAYRGFFNVRVENAPWETREGEGEIEVCRRCHKRRGEITFDTGGKDGAGRLVVGCAALR